MTMIAIVHHHCRRCCHPQYGDDNDDDVSLLSVHEDNLHGTWKRDNSFFEARRRKHPCHK